MKLPFALIFLTISFGFLAQTNHGNVYSWNEARLANPDTIQAISFEKMKETLIKEGVQDADSWNSINEIPHKIIFSLIQRIKKKLGS